VATIAQISEDLAREILDFQAKAAKTLDLDPNEPPHHIVTEINRWARDAKSQHSVPDEDTILQFATLLAEQFVRAFGWHWGEVTWSYDSANSRTCILPTDNSLSINPFWWVSATLRERDSVNFLLKFNMLVAGDFPHHQPNDASPYH
jgi:hypothetical protein